MQFLDEIPYMRLFSANKKIYAPIDPSNRKKGAAIMLLTENPVDSSKLMELPYLYNPGLFTGLYIDRNVNAYINSGAIIDDEVNDPDSAVNEAVIHTVKQKDLEIKLDLHTSSANDVAVLKRILNEKKILKWYKELNCRERYIPFEITVHAYPSVKDLAHGANKVALKNKEIATNTYSTFDEIFIVAPSGYNKSLEKSEGKYENYVMNEIITQACMNTSRRCSRFIANSIGTALSGQLNDKFAEKIENDWAGIKDDKIAVAYTISKMYKEEGMRPIRDMVKTGDLYGLTKYASRNFVRRISGVYEATLTAAERKAISDKDYGLPGQKKYPMPDESHVRSAIRFFNHVDPSDEAELARNINKKIKQYGLDVNVGKDNRFSKYHKKKLKTKESKQTQKKESAMLEFDWEPDKEITKSKVYFTDRITPDSLVEIYKALGIELNGKVAVKISTGEPGKGPRYCLNPQLIGKFVNSLDGTIVETNVAYEGPRHTTEAHWETIKKHGYYDIAPCDILDEDGDYSIPVENGLVLKNVLAGKHMKNYDSFVILSHFKGHAMGGYGGALKNVAIGLSSADGKKVVHSGGHVTDRIAGMTDDGGMDSADKPVHDLFLRSMADANKAFGKEMRSKGSPVVYINVANNISVDCDCDPEPHAPTMKDIGIFASLDPVAVDQAAIDAVYAAPDSDDVIERIESRHGLKTIEYAMELGLGSRDYDLIDIDKQANKAKIDININESILFDNDDIVLNLDKWSATPGNNILYVTGLSGSGKTTIAHEYAEKYGAKVFSLDWIAGTKHKDDKVLKQVRKELPEYAEAIDCHFQDEKYKDMSWEEINNKYLDPAMLRAIDLIKEDSDTLYAVEGLQLFYNKFPEDFFTDKPLVIKGSSIVTSAIRRLKRNIGGYGKKDIAKEIHYILFNLSKQEKRLNKFKSKYNESVLQEVKFENDKGEKVPKTCPKCGAKVGVFFRGEPVFLCSNKDCGKYFGTVPFDESTILEGDGGTKLMSLSKFISVPMTPQNIRFYKDQAKGLSHIRTGDNCKGKIFIENKDGERRVVGFYNTETKPNGEVWLQAIEVMPNYQSQGIGKLLLQDSIKEGAKYLAVAKNNTRAKSMYINHGFKSYERTDKMVFMKLESTILEDSIDDEAKKVANERQGVRYFDFINNISNLFKDIGALTARPRMDPEKGEYEKLRPWLMTLVDKADSMKRIQYLRRDAYTGINQLSTLSKNMKDVKAGTQSRYVNVNYINNLFKKGNSPEKVDAHIKWMKEEYIPYINNRAKEIRKSTNESYDLIPLPVRSINESMNDNGYIFTEDYIMNEDFITFFNGMDDQVITEAEKKYDAKLKNYLFQQRMKNNKAVVMRYQEMKAMSPWIKKTYLKLPMYRGYNIFVDLSYYHGLFLKNLKLTNDNAINMYWDFINRILNDTEYKGIYNKITIFIPVYPGAWDVDNPEDLMNYRKSINPISLIVRMIRHNPGNLKAWGNKDILFVSPKGYFKINFTTFAQKDLAKFKQFIGKLATYDDIADDENEDGYGNKSVDTDSPAAITAKITDKIEKNTGIKLDDITGNGDMDKVLPEKVQVDHLRIRTGKFNIPASKIKGDEITDSNTVIIFAPNDDATVEAVKNSALDLKFSFSDKGFYTP